MDVILAGTVVVSTAAEAIDAATATACTCLAVVVVASNNDIACMMNTMVVEQLRHCCSVMMDVCMHGDG